MSSYASPSPASAQVGVVGLAVMGNNLARNFASRGYAVALYNRTQARTDAMMAAHRTEGAFVPAESVAEFVASLERPRRVIMMVQAGGRPTPRSPPSCRTSSPATSSSTVATPISRTPAGGRPPCARSASTSWAPGSPAARRAP